jgi:uncharacterized membrane protein YgcG
MLGGDECSHAACHQVDGFSRLTHLPPIARAAARVHTNTRVCMYRCATAYRAQYYTHSGSDWEASSTFSGPSSGGRSRGGGGGGRSKAGSTGGGRGGGGGSINWAEHYDNIHRNLHGKMFFL